MNARLGRRAILGGGLGGAALFLFGCSSDGTSAPATTTETSTTATTTTTTTTVPPTTVAPATTAETTTTVAAPPTTVAPAIGFASTPLQNGPMPTIAEGYEYAVLIPWREKIDGSGTSFPQGAMTAEEQTQAIGIGHDGMWYFGDDESGLLALNHEFGVNPTVIGAPVPAIGRRRRARTGRHRVVGGQDRQGCRWVGDGRRSQQSSHHGQHARGDLRPGRIERIARQRGQATSPPAR